jgi:serine/threonine protein kinase
MPLIPGTKLDGYEVLGLLGSGGMGEVYRARDPVLRREVAIKVLPSFVSQDPDRLRRFEQEAQAAAALNHPNILAVHRFGTFEGAPYLVSELLEGETLRQQLERGPLPVRKVIDYGVQIAHGLAAAHDKGIVHRDLKPENLFVTKNGRIKILDFGLAKLIQSQPDPDGVAPTQTRGTDPGMVVGTVGYMSPEQVRGKAVDHRADIFAFGAILYEMLAGKRAFQRPTSADTMSAILNEDPPGISQIVRTTPLGLQRIIHRCLEKNPEQRFQSASDLGFALEALSESGISSAAVIGTAGPGRRGKVLSWSLGMVAILATVAVTYRLMTRHKEVPFEHYSIQSLIDSEHVTMTAISPDGNYLAAVVRDPKGRRSMLVHHIPTNSERTIVQDASYIYQDIIFSPDGSYIYFRIVSVVDPDRMDVYRIPVLGGQPTRVLESVDFPVTFFDGGQRVCFYREDSTAGTYKFLSASADGGDEQVLANGKAPLPNSAACSPSGRSAVLVIGGKVESFDFALGSRKPLTSPTMLGVFLSDLLWARDGQSLFVTGSKPKSSTDELSVVSYPSGDLRQITNGLNDFSGVSLTADGKTIASTQRRYDESFGELSLADPAHVQEHQSGGRWVFTWLDNDRILVSDPQRGGSVIDLRKDEATAVNAAKGRWFASPSPCGPDTLVVIGGFSDKSGSSVYRMRPDGSGLTQLTKGPHDGLPRCTSDDKWLFYLAIEGETGTVMRQGLQGGAAAQMAIPPSYWYDLSPSGDLLAYITPGAAHNQAHIVSADSLQEIKSFLLPALYNQVVVFSADNKSVFYAAMTGLDTTIWRQPLDGPPPVKVANIPGKYVNFLKLSPDGQRLGLSLLAPTSEAVLLRDVH